MFKKTGHKAEGGQILKSHKNLRLYYVLSNDSVMQLESSR